MLDQSSQTAHSPKKKRRTMISTDTSPLVQLFQFLIIQPAHTRQNTSITHPTRPELDTSNRGQMLDVIMSNEGTMGLEEG
jgi:hypothetical protein